jgi:hypothetical protein
MSTADVNGGWVGRRGAVLVGVLGGFTAICAVNPPSGTLERVRLRMSGKPARANRVAGLTASPTQPQLTLADLGATDRTNT